MARHSHNRHTSATSCASLLLVSVFSSALGFYTASDDVVQLTSKSFAKLMASGPGVVAVEFYAPWCGHCKALAPQWNKAATNLKGIATLAAMDCDDKANNAFCTQQLIQGFPTIKIFGPDQQKNPYTGELTKESEDYQGPRTAKAIVDAVMSHYSDVYVQKLKSEDEVQKYIKSEEPVPRVVLLSDKHDVSSLYKSLSTQLHGHMTFAQVHSESVPEVYQLMGLEAEQSLPVVEVFQANGVSAGRFNGPVKAPALLKFLKQFASGTTDEDGAQDDKGKAAPPPPPPQASLTTMAVDELSSLDEKEEMALVLLSVADSSEPCESKVSAYKTAAAELQGVLPLVVTNLTPADLDKVVRYPLNVDQIKSEVESDGCALRVVLLPFGTDKEDLEEYQVYDGEIEGKSLFKWVGSHISSIFTVELVPAGIQAFVSIKGDVKAHTLPDYEDGLDADEEPSAERKVADEFWIPPKVVLFTNKDEPPALFKALALAFQTRMPGLTFGWVRAHEDSNSELVKQFKPHKVPGVLLIVPMFTDPKDPKKPPTPGARNPLLSVSSQPYTGANNLKAMSAWLENMLRMLEKAYGLDSPERQFSSKSLLEQVPHVSSDDEFKTQCVDKGAGICVIGLLPSDGKEAKPWIKLLAKVAAKHLGQPLYFSWLDANKYTAFAKDCSLSPTAIPTVVAVSVKRMRVAPFSGSLSLGSEGVTAMTAFIDSVLSGKARTDSLQVIPRVSVSQDDSDASAGGDDMIVEEEFDLSDIMAEEVEGAEAALSKEERLKQAEEELKAEEEAAKQKLQEEAATKKKKSKKSKKNKKKKIEAKTEL